MSLEPALVLALAVQCAPRVAPETVLAVAHAESALDPLAIGVNDGAPVRLRPQTPAEAAGLARDLIAQGRDIDLGLGQINVRNLARLGLTLEAAFDPCQNLAASARILEEGYRRGVARVGAGQPALRIALSYYNTGDPQRGERNGYVRRVVAHAHPRSSRRRPGREGFPGLPPARPAVRLRAAGAFVLSPSGVAP